MMCAIRVLITRYRPQALRTALAVKKLGACPILLPLVEVVPLDVALPSPVGFDGLIASSANAFTLLKRKKDWRAFHSLPLFCVGEQTAHAARQTGFSYIATIAKNVDHLQNILKNNQMQNFLYLAGQYRRPLLEKSLQNQGKNITIVEIYTRFPLIPDITQYDTLPAPVDYVLLYSSLTARQCVQTLPPIFFARTTQFLCLSERIAKAVPQPYATQCIMAKEPNETSLLAALESAIKPTHERL